MCEGPHGVKHSVEKEWCTLCDEAGCDDVYDVRGRCDEAGAHHRDTAHIFTRAEPETAAGHQGGPKFSNSQSICIYHCLVP